MRIQSCLAGLYLLSCSSGVSSVNPDAGTTSSPDGAVTGGDAGGASPTVGAPCVPTSENDATFHGFDEQEVTLIGSGSPICVAVHFQGRVTCPYGQSATGQAPAGAAACTTPSGAPVTGAVRAQCADRPASKAVIWSCRCQNVQGRSDDGATYCTCPSSTACTQLIESIGASKDTTSGAYCLPASAAVSDAGPVCTATCDPATAPCP